MPPLPRPRPTVRPPKLRIGKRFQGYETTYVSGSRLSLQALALTLVPGVEGQDPASLGEPMAPGIRFIRHQDSSCRSLLPILCPRVTPSPLSQGEVAIDKGVSGWSLQSRADPFWFPPLVSTSVVSLGLGDSGGGKGKQGGVGGGVGLTSQEVMSRLWFSVCKASRHPRGGDLETEK